MKKIRTILIVILALFGLYAIIGFFVLPPVIKSVAAKNLSQALHRRVDVKEVRTNPFTLVVEVRGLSISDARGKGEFVSAGLISLDLDALSILKRALILRELKVENPSLKVIRYPGGTYNFSDLLKGPKKKGKPLLFSLANIQVKGGQVVMDDEPVGKTHSVKEIHITIPFISNIAHYSDVFVQPRFQAVVNGTPLALAGRTKPFSDSLETSLSLRLKGIDIPRYLAYLPMKPRFKVASGSLDLVATGTYRQFRDKRKPELTVRGTLDCRKLSVTDMSGNPLIDLPGVSASLSPSKVLEGNVHFGRIAFSSPEIRVSRDRKGALNLLKAFAGETPNRKPAPGRQKGNPMTVVADEILVNKGRVPFEDLSGSSPVRITLDEMEVHCRDITTAAPGGGSLDLACRVNRTGNLSLGIGFALKPLAAEIRIDAAGLEPAWVQPYIMDVIPVLVRHGSLSAKGLVKVAQNKDAPLGISFSGDVRMIDFASVDREFAEDLVSWKQLSLTGIDLKTSPASLVVREVGLSSFASHVSVNAKGVSNLGAMVRKKTKESPEPAGKTRSAPMKIAIGRVSLKNGRFTFTDRSVSPGYSTALTNIGGSITGLSSEEFRKANVTLNARLDNQAPISITGSINPLKQDLFVDLTARLDNIELTPMTPYSGKYLGYAIEKGKVSLNLKYLIDKKKLDSHNDVLVDQFTFGGQVDSKDATKLPVRLAVALLRDRNGNIDLRLPVTGRTDDPDFHIGKIIVKILVNILEKAATSPFALLEALYPGAAELGNVEFDPGKAALTEDARKKISELAKILNERPLLKLEVKGYVDAATDRTGLVNTLFERKLKAVKLKDLLRQGMQASSVDDIVIEPNEYSSYLKKAYKAEAFPKPSNFLGIAKSLPDEEMKKLIIEHISVTDDDLKSLAAARAQQIRDGLVETGKIDPARIFLLETDALKPEKIDKVGNSRVSISMR